MRVLIVTESFVPRVNGVTRSVTSLCDHLRLRGHDALVVAAGDGPASYAGYPVIRVIGVSGVLYPDLTIAPIAPGFRRLVRAFDPDVLHLASPAVLGAAAVRAARRARVPIAAHFQTDVAAYARHYGGGIAAPVVWRWLRRLHNRCDATYAPSDALAAELRRRGVRGVRVSGRGVDTTLFAPGRPGAAAAIGRWPAGDGERVLCVSRLAPEKRLDRLVALAARRPELRLLIVGDGPARASLERAATPNVAFGGILQGSDLGDVYAAADLFAFPSETETFGQVVQEAMASALPVVGVAAGGVAELIEDGVTGVLAEPGGDSFERAVVELAGQPARAAALGAAARRAVEPRSWPAILDALLADYRELALAAAPRRGRPPVVNPTMTRTRPLTDEAAWQGRAAAIFDVDRTILAGSSFLAVAAPARRAGLVGRRILARAALHQLLFAARGADHRVVEGAGAAGARAVRGIDAGELTAVARAALPTRILPRIFPAARQAMAAHRRRGEAVFLVSSSPEEVVAPIAEALGVDGYAATRAEVVDGKYTGRLLTFCHGPEKLRVVRQLATRQGIDLARSTAYADSITDLPLLDGVGHAVCVNPDRQLRAEALRRGWEVRRFSLKQQELGHPERLGASTVAPHAATPGQTVV